MQTLSGDKETCASTPLVMARHHASKFYDWREHDEKVNEHNGWVPRDFWLEDWEKQAIIGFHLKNPLEGYAQGRSHIGLLIQG
jgi:hypothetical protein